MIGAKYNLLLTVFGSFVVYVRIFQDSDIRDRNRNSKIEIEITESVFFLIKLALVKNSK